jgi:hypothetical protein
VKKGEAEEAAAYFLARPISDQLFAISMEVRANLFRDL